MAFFTATAKQAGYVLAILAAIDIVLGLCYFFANKYDGTSLAVLIVLDIIIALAGLGITKKNSKAYYIALIFIIIGVIGSICEIIIAAGGFTIAGASCDFVTGICNLIVTGIMFGVLYFNKKELLE